MVYKIELKSIKIYEGMSEETTCFQSDLFINGKKVGYCKNSGHGGNTDYHGFTKEDNVLLEEVNQWCKKNPIPIPQHDYQIDDLEGRVDEIVHQELLRRDKKKFDNKLNKRMLTHLLFTKSKEGEEVKEYSELGWKGHTIESLLKHPKGPDTVKNVIKREIGNGYRLLNTNIPENLLK